MKIDPAAEFIGAVTSYLLQAIPQASVTWRGPGRVIVFDARVVVGDRSFTEQRSRLLEEILFWTSPSDLGRIEAEDVFRILKRKVDGR